MIYDLLENLPDYTPLAPDAVPPIIEFLDRCGKGGMTPGRYELDGDRLFVNVQSYETRPFDRTKLEYHKRYVDLQLLLAGKETLYYAPKGTPCVTPYDAKGDCGFDEVPKSAVPLTLEPGNFVLLLPEEGHLPGTGDGGTVIKAVVKISADLLI